MDGGDNWFSIYVGIINLEFIVLIDMEIVYVVGVDGLILKNENFIFFMNLLNFDLFKIWFNLSIDWV